MPSTMATTPIVLDADFVSDLPGSYLSKLTYNPTRVKSLSDV